MTSPALTRTECGRCGVVLRDGRRRHFCGEPYPLKASDDIRVVEYVPAAQLRGAVAVLREIADYGATDDPLDGEDARALRDKATAFIYGGK